jgi:hypothetical protein
MRRRPPAVVAQNDEAYPTAAVERRPWSPAQLRDQRIGMPRRGSSTSVWAGHYLEEVTVRVFE